MWGVGRMRLGEQTGTQSSVPSGPAAKMLRAFFAKHLAGADADVFGISVLYDSQADCCGFAKYGRCRPKDIVP